MITIKQGEDYTKVLKLEYADTKQPVDLSDFDAYSQMRTKPGGELLATAGCTVQGSYGLISVSFSALQTASMPEGECGFDVWIVDSVSQEKHPIYTTRVKIIGSYTEDFGGNND